jgi:hypothetical protein
LVKIDEDGTVFYMVFEDPSTIPTAQQVVDAAGSPIINGEIDLAANSEGTINLTTGLIAGMTYDVYLAAMDYSGNLQSSAFNLDFTTQSAGVVSVDLTYADGSPVAFTEQDLSSGHDFEVRVQNDVFNSGLDTPDFELVSAPTGLTLTAATNGSANTKANLSMMFSGDIDSDVTNFQVRVLEDALAGGGQYVTPEKTITALDEDAAVTAVRATNLNDDYPPAFYQEDLNGWMFKMKIDGTGVKYKTSLADTDFTLLNAPTGITLNSTVTRDTDTCAELTLDFDGTSMVGDELNFQIQVNAGTIEKTNINHTTSAMTIAVTMYDITLIPDAAIRIIFENWASGGQVFFPSDGNNWDVGTWDSINHPGTGEVTFTKPGAVTTTNINFGDSTSDYELKVLNTQGNYGSAWGFTTWVKTNVTLSASDQQIHIASDDNDAILLVFNVDTSNITASVDSRP